MKPKSNKRNAHKQGRAKKRVAKRSPPTAYRKNLNVMKLLVSHKGFQADILDVPVIRPTVAETTALGAAYAAGLAVGFWKNFDELRSHWGKDKEWKPQMAADRRDQLYSGWKKAVTRTFDWVDDQA